MRSKKNKNNAWDQSTPISYPSLKSPSNHDQLFPQSFFRQDPHAFGDLRPEQQHKIDDPTNVLLGSSEVNPSQIEYPPQSMSKPQNEQWFQSIPLPPDISSRLLDTFFQESALSQPCQMKQAPPRKQDFIPPQRLVKKKYRKYYRYVFAEQTSSEKNSGQRVEANILGRIINETIEQTINEQCVDCEIRDHNRILLKKKGLQKLTMLVGLVSEYPIEKQQKIYDFNRKMMDEALNDRALIKKMIIKSSKIQELDKKKQYMRQIKVYLNRLKSRLIATRTQSK